EERAAARADALVRQLLDAHLAQTPAIIDELAEYRRWADPLLENEVRDRTARPDRQLRARLALLPVDRAQVNGLREGLLEAEPGDFSPLREALAPFRGELVEGLWNEMQSEGADPRRRFRAAAALATYDSGGAGWEGGK